jgi:HD-GYP domain-containing protein (c-di-GMP phosphodiesterase class II)
MAAIRKKKAAPPARGELARLREWQRRLSLLLNYSRAISTHKDLPSLLRLLVDASCKILRAERATVFLLDPVANELWSRASSTNEVFRVPADRGIVGESIARGRVINIPDAYADRRFNPDVDKATGFRTRSLLTAPLTDAQGRPLGALQMLNKRGGRFSREDERMLVLFAEQAGAALENARLYDELQAAIKDTIFRLAAAAEFKDEDTHNHLERVSRYSGVLAEELGLSEEWRRLIRLASPMHDIGKLGVPDAVLRKPGKLNEEEWVEMRKHPLHGSKILGNATNDVIRMSERVARCHHEKWDGSGYPAKLSGEDIPLEARVVALVDVFDALMTRRPYKEPFSLEDTLRIIDEGAGKHFDPRLVEAFHRCLPRILSIQQEFSDPAPPEKSNAL